MATLKADTLLHGSHHPWPWCVVCNGMNTLVNLD